jgi:predicted SAM-dependent methyltransferase
MSKVLLNFGKLPTFMGCIDQNIPLAEDHFWEMKWGYKDDSTFGVIDPPPAELIYLNQHNELVGPTWQNHLTSFSKFVSEKIQGNVLEIGAGHCLLSERVDLIKPGLFTSWDILEPNPLIQHNTRGELFREYFPTESIKKSTYDVIVHSHVLEHVASPITFLFDCYKALKNNGEIIISLPNMKNMADNSDLNLLMFEHLTYLTYDEILNIANFTGFEVIDYEYFENHSIFFHLKKIEKISISDKVFTTAVTSIEIDKLIANYSNEIMNKIDEIKKFIDHNDLKFYIFGAHIFTQYLVALGLDLTKINGLLDNSKFKQGKRLYGTNLKVSDPKDLSERDNLGIILPMGNYESEVTEQLMELGINRSKIFSLRGGIKDIK